jgi:hypothetical protein
LALLWNSRTAAGSVDAAFLGSYFKNRAELRRDGPQALPRRGNLWGSGIPALNFEDAQRILNRVERRRTLFF